MARWDPPSAFQSGWNFLPTARVLTNSAIDFASSSVMAEIPLLCGGLLSGSPFAMVRHLLRASSRASEGGSLPRSSGANRGKQHIFCGCSHRHPMPLAPDGAGCLAVSNVVPTNTDAAKERTAMLVFKFDSPSHDCGKEVSEFDTGSSASMS